MRIKNLIYCFQVLIFVMAGSLAAYPQDKMQGAAKGISTVINSNKQKKSSSESGKKNSNPTKSGSQKQNSVDPNSLKGYINIIDVELANTDNNNADLSKFGAKLYASEIKYLRPKIVYDGLGKDSHEIELQIAIYNGEGELNKGKNSPEGYTYVYKFTENPGRNEQLLNGWGTSKGGTYKPGEYRIEISYKGNKLYTKEFRLYSGETPIVDNPILDIKKVTYYCTDKANNKLTEPGEPLYADNLYYLTGIIDYVGKYKNDQSIKLYIKIFNSDGNLVKGNSSPPGFSYSTDLTIKEGSNSVSTSGYGSSNGKSYSAGRIKLEYWLDGEKIYEDWVEVKPKRESTDAVYDISKAMVDLGLPSGTLWATCNLGASKPEEAGLYFAWGELDVKNKYTHSNSNYYNKSCKWLRDNSIIDAKGNLTSEYDIASVRLGSQWRMPTVSEMTELDEKCKWTWTSEHGVNGFKVTGPNGKSIFLPATGWYNSASDGMLDCVGERSEYWTASVKNGDAEDAHCLFFMTPDRHYSSTGHYVDRSRGLTIRPVYGPRK